MDATAISHLSQRLQDQAASYAESSGDERQRQKLLATSHELLKAIESPKERIARMCYADIYLFIATRVLVDLNVFGIIAEANGPVTVTQLGEKTGADPALLARLLKHVCTQGFVEEKGVDEYAASGITREMATPEGAGVVLDMFQTLRVGDGLPDFLKMRKYQNPTNKDDSAWKHGMQTPDHYFEYISRPGREHLMSAFHNHMRFKTLGLKWHEMPNITQATFGDYKAGTDDVLMVDIGGSSGHDLLSFRSAHQDIPGRLVLQDLPQAIETAKAAGELERVGIEATTHDFFTPQPVLGARVYYLKMVLHDWPDEQCKQILANLKPALKKGHSRILLNEIVVPDVGAGWFETSVDMIMMCCHSAQERREKDWRALIGGVEGLKVERVYDVDGAVEKVIEVVLE